VPCGKDSIILDFRISGSLTEHLSGKLQEGRRLCCTAQLRDISCQENWISASVVELYRLGFDGPVTKSESMVGDAVPVGKRRKKA
jgi:hypothetical protein